MDRFFKLFYVWSIRTPNSKKWQKAKLKNLVSVEYTNPNLGPLVTV